MRTLLICHEDDELARKGLTGWLASFSDLVGVVVLRETSARKRKRIRREIRRVGWLRFLDVLAFRLYYRLFLAGPDRAWEKAKLEALEAAYPQPDSATPVLVTTSPNTPDAEHFIRECRPGMSFAICKTLLNKSIFSIPELGTWVLHPGVCPEYRNAHGCFWALANRDLNRVGMTLLRIDDGIDTGPIYGTFTYAYDEIEESHARIQRRVVYDNLAQIQNTLLKVVAGSARPLATEGRTSHEWGQPWLTKYVSWKIDARREKR